MNHCTASQTRKWSVFGDFMLVMLVVLLKASEPLCAIGVNYPTVAIPVDGHLHLLNTLPINQTSRASI